MPGIIPHLLAGTSMFAVGELYFHFRSKENHPLSDHILLLSITLIFSLIPDFPLGLYYIFHVYSPEILMEFHLFTHAIVTPLSIVLLLLVKYIFNTKRESIWILGIICILIHITMDTYIHEGGLWV